MTKRPLVRKYNWQWLFGFLSKWTLTWQKMGEHSFRTNPWHRSTNRHIAYIYSETEVSNFSAVACWAPYINNLNSQKLLGIPQINMHMKYSIFQLPPGSLLATFQRPLSICYLSWATGPVVKIHPWYSHCKKTFPTI